MRKTKERVVPESEAMGDLQRLPMFVRIEVGLHHYGINRTNY
jgi:hypothetical protein